MVHRILERFFRELKARDRLHELGAYSVVDRQLLDDIAETSLLDLETRGVTGHPLVWENTSATIRADLRTFLIKDERWRRAQRLTPAFFEQPFGMDKDAHSWPGWRSGSPASVLRFAARSIASTWIPYVGEHLCTTTDWQRQLVQRAERGSTYGRQASPSWPYIAGQSLASMPDLADEVDGAFWFVSSPRQLQDAAVRSAAV